MSSIRLVNCTVFAVTLLTLFVPTSTVVCVSCKYTDQVIPSCFEKPLKHIIKNYYTVYYFVLVHVGLPSPPQNSGYHVRHYGPHNVTVTVQWGYPEFDGGVPVDNYTISGTNIMTISSQINETTLTLPYNASQSIEVAATNCNGTSGTAIFIYFESEYNCLAIVTMKIIKFVSLLVGTN